MDINPETVMGRKDGKDILFEDLTDVIQIALQNSDRWEEWKDKFLKVQERAESFKKTADDLGNIVKSLNFENADFQKKVDGMFDALNKIRQDVDSLKWAKEVATDAIERHFTEVVEE